MTGKDSYDKLIQACEDSIKLYGWQLMTACVLAGKVSSRKMPEENKYAWLIPKEYFNHVLCVLKGTAAGNLGRAQEEVWNFIQRRTAECGRRRGLHVPQEVEDAASLAFLLTWMNLDRVQVNFFAFTDNKIRDAITRVFRDRLPVEPVDEGTDSLESQSEEDALPPDSGPTPPDVTEANELAEAVWRVLDHKLKTYPRAAVKQLKIIELRWKHEKGYEEIARELGIEPGNAHTMHSRGLTLLSQNKAMRELSECL